MNNIGAAMPGINVKHGHTRGNTESPTYRTWKAMLTRCRLPTHASYRRYGAKGITVCARWYEFENFLADMGVRPPGTSLDRYPDKFGNYEPGNCRWATPIEQNANRRNSRFITASGENLHVSEWARRLGTDRSTIRNRLKAGWDEQSAVTVPVDTRFRHKTKEIA